MFPRVVSLLAIGMAFGVLPAHSQSNVSVINRNVSSLTLEAGQDKDPKPPPKKPKQQAKTGGGSQPTGIAPGATAGIEKKKGKGGKKGGDTQEFLKVEMKDALITGRTSSNPPNGPPSGGLLGGNNTGFNQGGPSAAGTVSAPSAPPPAQIK